MVLSFCSCKQKCIFFYLVYSSGVPVNFLPPLLCFMEHLDAFFLILQVFRKEVIFVVDISASMRGDPLDNAKAAVLTALSKLNPADSFNIIAFNSLSLLFSSSMEPATKEVIENASQWIANNFVADGSTNISLPLSQVLKDFNHEFIYAILVFVRLYWQNCKIVLSMRWYREEANAWKI